MRRPRLAGLVAAALAVGALAAAVPAAPSVLVLGDSYASGEGLSSAEGPCGTERERSWGALVADGLGAPDLQLLACSGAEVADLTVGGDLGRPAQLAGAEPADLVLLTISGNDLGFTDLVADCLGFADLREPPAVEAAGGGGWSELVDSGTVDRGCDVSQADLLDRIEAFGAADRFVTSPDGGTAPLAGVYSEVVRRAVRDGGRLVVVGYPALFAEVAGWPARYGDRCHALRSADAEELGAVVVALDEQVAASVAAANEQLGADLVEHVSLLQTVAGTADGGDHRLCGGGEPWINGLTVAEGGIDVARLLAELAPGAGGLDLEAIGARPAGSFHPSTAGHRGIADAVLDHLGR